MKDKSVRI